MAEKSRLAAEIKAAMGKTPGLPRPNPTRSYWQHIPHALAEHQSAVFPVEVDIAIIGSGMTGVAAAKVLLESNPRVRVAVLEARGICSGGTGRNGGHLKANAVWNYKENAENFGAAEAQKIVDFQMKTCDRVRQVAKEYCPVESELRDVMGITVFDDKELFAKYRASVGEYLETQPSKPADYEFLEGLAALRENGIHTGVGIMKVMTGAMWPYRLVTKVWEALLTRYSDRFFLEAFTPVASILHQVPAGQGCHSYAIQTPRGRLHTTRVIHCTNGFAGQLIPGLVGKLYPVRGNMTVQEPGAKVPNHGATRSWGFISKPYYDRTRGFVNFGLTYLTQNAHSGYFFFGGDLTPVQEMLTDDDTKYGESSKIHLQDQLATSFGPSNGWKHPREKGTVAAWSGIMGFTGDGVPMVGRLPKSCTHRGGDGEFIAAGYNGYGMPNCWMAGEAVAQLALGNSLPDFIPAPYKLTEERARMLSVEGSATSFLDIVDASLPLEVGRL